MKWKEVYKSRLTDADTALMAVKSGDKVIIPFAAGQPQSTLEALARRIKDLDSINVAQLVTITKEVPYLRPEVKEKVKFITSYVGSVTREHVNRGEGEFVPVFLHRYSTMYSEIYKPDVALIQVTPPDKHGYCSLGVSVDHNKKSAQYAGVVIAEVNEQMPRTLGDSFLHVSEITYFVENSHPVLEIPRPKITEVEKEIGYNVASLIEDGSCLQLGIGAIPDAVLQFLTEKRGLGIHTEMFSDGVVELFEAGVIDNKNKTLHPDKMIATFLMGTRKLYDFVDDNPAVWMFPCEYTNNPFIIAQNNKMISVNSAIEVDLMGQAASESIGVNQYSGVGGQVDFIRGATTAPGGKAILALPSTAGKNNEKSRISAFLAPGTPVTTSRNDIDYVVTEYGVASLRYKSLRERAKELIAIAHPDFRPELREELRKMAW